MNIDCSARRRIYTYTPPLSRKLLKKHAFFELYPFDGGGQFIHREIIGTLDDGEAALAIHDGALNTFGAIPRLDFGCCERWRTIERSSWLNRFYFLVPLAKTVTQGKDRGNGRLVLDVILHFINNYSPPQGREALRAHWGRVLERRNRDYNEADWATIQADETDVEYIWFDFQPASRIIHILHSLYFISNAIEMTAEEAEQLVASIDAHAHAIAVTESDCCRLKSPGNHQSLRALALLYAADFLKGHPSADLYLEQGLAIMNFHIENDFAADGVLKEVSPSYHFFETWHVRDAYILARRNGWELTECAESVLRAAFDFASRVRCPDGRSVVINDGYPLNLDTFVKTNPVPSICSAGEPSPSHFFADAGIATYADALHYLALDASPFTGKYSHYHGGKGGLTYYYAEIPILCDSGCCSYDDDRFGAYKDPTAHSSLLIDGCGDSLREGLYQWAAFAATQSAGWQGHRIDCRITSNAPQWRDVCWTRTLELGNGLRGGDSIEGIADTKCSVELIFNFHPEVGLEITGNQAILSCRSRRFALHFQSPETLSLIARQGACFVDHRHQSNIQLWVRLEGSQHTKGELPTTERLLNWSLTPFTAKR